MNSKQNNKKTYQKYEFITTIIVVELIIFSKSFLFGGDVKMVYIPIEVNGPIRTGKQVNIQFGNTQSIPQILLELHEGHKYLDLGDNCTITATVTNTDLETVDFTGTITIENPHRGQIKAYLNKEDFSMTGLNTITFLCDCWTYTFSFQFLVYVQTVSKNMPQPLTKNPMSTS